MAIGYGAGRGYIVKASDVNAVYTNNMTIITNGNVSDQYVFEGSHDTGGCGGPDSGVYIQLKDNISWSKITVMFTVTGTSSCWTFMGGGDTTTGTTTGSIYGTNGTPPATMTSFPGGNINYYDESLGDRIFWDTNAFSSNANFVRKLSACDNNNTNFFHSAFATGGNGTKTFWVTTRRKSSSSGLAGVWAGRSCNATGYNTRIENIIIW